VKKTSTAVKGDYVRNPVQPNHNHQTIFVDFGAREVTEVHDYENGKLVSTYKTGDQPRHMSWVLPLFVLIAIASCYHTSTTLLAYLP
jgi:hypothetical protein